MQSINTIVLKVVKFSELAQRKLIPYRSNIESGGVSKDLIFWRYSKTAILCIGIWP